MRGAAHSNDVTVCTASKRNGFDGLRVRSRVSSDVSALNRLNRTFTWIPNEFQIRPTTVQLEVKQARMKELDERWASNGDFVRHEIFGKSTTMNDANQRCTVDDTVGANDVVFCPSHFAYNVQVGSNHWVMWFGCRDEVPEMNVSDCIMQRLREHLGHDTFDFAWYPNPKMSLPEFYHVHVFWVSLVDPAADPTADPAADPTADRRPIPDWSITMCV